MQAASGGERLGLMAFGNALRQEEVGRTPYRLLSHSTEAELDGGHGVVPVMLVFWYLLSFGISFALYLSMLVVMTITMSI